MPTIASRTPEGQPFHCRVCGSDVVIDPSVLAFDAPCPVCGTLLWLSRYPQIASCIDMNSLPREHAEWLTRFLMECDDADSFDRMVLMDELCNLLEIDVPADDAASFDSIDDFLAWWEKQRRG